ncbi:hypothetical protein [Culicoidibacter larvae]|uniref:DUF4406 domain-containing protein n=1 Tax=Culicoidibacter larvae TaxID=2579976 RepID=A0A5R8QEX2_9FIRM|nr:hypothetical protein [Culicoidibacter larvae]TLG76548.1 hypothetical protein FEZ08_02725 [Culicoidibacter larvae]
MKIITVCGSLKFKNKIMQITEQMTLQGNCMLSIIYPTIQTIHTYNKADKDLFGDMHKERIRLSDAILVVNIDNYIGESTQSEIEFAQSLGKEVIYFTDL